MGYDRLKAIGNDKDSYPSKQVIDASLFELEEHAVQFVEEFIAQKNDWEVKIIHSAEGNMVRG